MSNNAEELKRAALILFRGMNFKVGQVVIDVNTAYDSATVRISEIHKKIKEGDEVTVTEARTIK